MSVAVTSQRYIERGAYSIVGKTGSMAAALAAGSPIFSFRWATDTADAKALIDRINVSVGSLATGFAAGVGYIDAVVARSFSVTDYGGTAVSSISGVAGTAGTLATDHYFYVVTAIGPWGESAASNEIDVSVTGPTGSVTVTYSAITGATGYRIYRGLETGVYDQFWDDLASTWVDDGTAGTPGTPRTSTVVGGLTLTTNNAKRKTGFDTSLVSSIRMSSTATLVAGTRTLDAQAFAARQFTVGTAVQTVAFDGDLWKPDPGTYPLMLAANEGFVIRATVPATGVWQGVITVDWREVLG